MLDTELAGEGGSAKALGLEVFAERHAGHCASRAHLRQAPCAHRGKDDPAPPVQPQHMENVIRSGSLYLRLWREHRNLTLEHVANILEVKHSTVLRWEKGNVRLEPAQVAALASIYECTKEELAFSPDEREKGKLMHRLLETFRSLDAKDAANVVDIAERMPSARK